MKVDIQIEHDEDDGSPYVTIKNFGGEWVWLNHREAEVLTAWLLENGFDKQKSLDERGAADE